jgi:glycosyltransferase 2 family protein
VKRLLITLLKITISVAIIGYLVYDATRGKNHANVFADLVRQPKQWHMLAAALVACAAATMLTFIRWWYLVRALDVPCPFGDGIRISFWGCLLNMAPLGIVGGDVVKAVMLSHEHPQDRAKAVASVLVDRTIGLYLLFIVASAAILLTGFWRIDAPDIIQARGFSIGIFEICMLTFGITAIGTVAVGILLGPAFIYDWLIWLVHRVPRAGKPLESLIVAVRMYRSKPGVLLVSSVMTIGVHCGFAVGCYLIACGLPGNHLSLADHFVVMPLSSATQVIPLPFGPLEAVLNLLYVNVPVAGPPIAPGQGLVVALVYRLISLLIAGSGVCCFLGSRREMVEVMHEAERE